MKISMVASSGLGFTLPRHSLEKGRLEAVERAFHELSEIGYDGVELSIEEPDMTEARELERISEDCGVEIPAIGTGLIFGYKGLSLSDIIEANRRKAVRMVARTIRIAADLNSLVIIGLVRGRIGSNSEKRISKLKKSMEEVDIFAEKNEVELALEPLNRYESDYINSVGQALNFISCLGLQRTGLLLDTFHMNIEESSFDGAISKAGRKIMHVHMADSNRLAPGLGHIPFRKILNAIAALPYEGYLSAEIMAVPTPTEAAKETIRYLRPLLRRV